MNIKKHIPNAITCLNLVAGCIACTEALCGNFEASLLWIIAGAGFDFMDGLMARMLKAYSEIGKELDSLADVVCFGVAPSMMVYSLLLQVCPADGVASVLPYLAFVIAAFSALRLAKFNLDTRQTVSFIGLPVPAHALFWAPLTVVLSEVLTSPSVEAAVCIALLAILSSLLLVSEIKMFSLKAKNLAWKGNELRFIMVASAAALITVFGYLGVSGSILLYIILSLLPKKSLTHA